MDIQGYWPRVSRGWSAENDGPAGAIAWPHGAGTGSRLGTAPPPSDWRSGGASWQDALPTGGHSIITFLLATYGQFFMATNIVSQGRRPCSLFRAVVLGFEVFGHGFDGLVPACCQSLPAQRFKHAGQYLFNCIVCGVSGAILGRGAVVVHALNSTPQPKKMPGGTSHLGTDPGWPTGRTRGRTGLNLGRTHLGESNAQTGTARARPACWTWSRGAQNRSSRPGSRNAPSTDGTGLRSWPVRHSVALVPRGTSCPLTRGRCRGCPPRRAEVCQERLLAPALVLMSPLTPLGKNPPPRTALGVR